MKNQQASKSRNPYDNHSISKGSGSYQSAKHPLSRSSLHSVSFNDNKDLELSDTGPDANQTIDEIINIPLKISQHHDRQLSQPQMTTIDDEKEGAMIQHTSNMSNQSLDQEQNMTEEMQSLIELPQVDQKLQESIVDGDVQETQQPFEASLALGVKGGLQQPKKKLGEHKDELPDFLWQGQQLSCKCSVCTSQLNIMKTEGLEPRARDVIKQHEKQAKFLAKQVQSDLKMQKLNQRNSERMEQIKQMQAENGPISLQNGIIQEMERIRETVRAQKFKKEDRFSFEEQGYHWLVEKMAGTPESTYMGCPVNVPKTILFSGGKPVKMFHSSSEDGCVNQIKPAMGSLTEMRKLLSSLATQRDKDYLRKRQQIKYEKRALQKKQALEHAYRTGGDSNFDGGPDEGAASSRAPETINKSRVLSQLSISTRGTLKDNSDGVGTSKDDAAQVTQLDAKLKRDNFLIRFKKGSEYFDKIVQELNWQAELGKKAADKYWQEVTSISLTPGAKIGLGKLYTFEFIAPCFEDPAKKVNKPSKRGLKQDSMSFYGKVDFDFRQFGEDDDMLRKQKPLQYCLKVCHLIGFYLQHVHGYDLLSMNVDFNQDEFDEIWLMQVDKLIVRRGRPVPTDKGTQIADFVLSQIEDLKRKKEKFASPSKTKDKRREVNPNEHELFSVNKRSQSEYQDTAAGGGSNRLQRQRRNSGLSPSNNLGFHQDQSSRSQMQIQEDQEESPHEKFRQMHPHYFILPKTDENRQSYHPKTQYNSNVSFGHHNHNNTDQDQSGDSSVVSKAFQLNSFEKVHRLNQVKDQRITYNKQVLDDQYAVAQDSSRLTWNSRSANKIRIKSNNNNNGGPNAKLSLQPQMSSRNYLAMYEGKQAKSTPMIDYGATFQAQFAARKQSQGSQEDLQEGQSQQKSLKQIHNLMQQASVPFRDCNEFEESMLRKTNQAMRTTCPILKKDKVIKSVQNAAQQHQNYRKSYIFYMKQLNDQKRIQNQKNTNHFRTTNSKQKQPKTLTQNDSSQNFKNGQQLVNQSTSQVLNSKREETTVDMMNEGINPFTTGEAMERFEVMEAQRKQSETHQPTTHLQNSSYLAAQGSSDKDLSISKHFRRDDMENSDVRDLTRMHAQSQRMRQQLYDQHVELQMRCDFLNQVSSVETLNIPTLQKKKDLQQIGKYKEMKTEFIKKQDEVGSKLVKDYHHKLIEDEEKKRELIRSSYFKINQRPSKQQIGGKSFINMPQDDTTQAPYGDDEPGSQIVEPLHVEVVKQLDEEDMSGMTHLKARQIAKFIVKQKEKREQNNIILNSAQNKVGRSTSNSGRKANFSSALLTNRSNLQSRDRKIPRERNIFTGQSANNNKSVRTSYNAWPYTGSAMQSQRKSRDIQPMSNKKVKELVKQDFLLTRQGQSHTLLDSQQGRSRINALNVASANLRMQNLNAATSLEVLHKAEPYQLLSGVLSQEDQVQLQEVNQVIKPQQFQNMHLLQNQVPIKDNQHHQLRNSTFKTSEGGTTQYGTYTGGVSSVQQNLIEMSQSQLQSVNAGSIMNLGAAQQHIPLHNILSTSSRQLMPDFSNQNAKTTNNNSNNNSNSLFQQKQRNYQNHSQLSVATNPTSKTFIGNPNSSQSNLSIKKQLQKQIQVKTIGKQQAVKGKRQQTTPNITAANETPESFFFQRLR